MSGKDGNSPDKKKRKKQLASTKISLITNLIHHQFSFVIKEEAQRQMDYIENRFVQSKLSESVEEGCHVLWIRGYEISSEELKKGYMGNYAVLYCELTPDNRYTLMLRKIPIDLNRHPQRKRALGKHPDWGYWVMRRIKKNWTYGSIDEAYSNLMSLAEDFPEVTIPSQNKLFTILYCKKPDDSMPLERVVLELKALPEGGFTITCEENTHQPSTRKPATQEQEQEEAPQLGRFTSMVAVKRNKRKNIADLVKKEPEDHTSD